MLVEKVTFKISRKQEWYRVLFVAKAGGGWQVWVRNRGDSHKWDVAKGDAPNPMTAKSYVRRFIREVAA